MTETMLPTEESEEESYQLGDEIENSYQKGE